MTSDGAGAAASLQQYHHSVNRLLVGMTLSSALSGMVMVLSVLSLAVLWRRGVQHRAAQALLVATILLLLSTVIFFAASIVSAFATTRLLYSQATGDLDDVAAHLHTAYVASVVVTCTLVINVTVGDTVVFWRAAALWGYQRWINIMAGVLIVATVVSGILATAYVSPVFSGPGPSGGPLYQPPKSIGVGTGFASLVCSVTANVVATALITAKTWTHWKTIKHSLAEHDTFPRALSLLLLLIETGIAYSAMWLFVAVFFGLSITRPPGTVATYSSVVGIFVGSCAVPLVAMYPMSIITIFALKQSPLEQSASLLTTVPFSPHIGFDGFQSDADTVPTTPEKTDHIRSIADAR
ncbi:uncharacterized protein BXZ73DRAFT_99928 [Epithele typhae]|uniref:uncharacterized protein n=1 Tax=Epithele typhae TaxID=378194 RepID=UPI002008BBD2|nr:uncharacterized protein BXZ73DRAFT_99928 [Epithele typhae]KAH9938866.1 hypothetical protein BXZ73DRAFT_99928 [Epithele typhae]